MPCDCVVCILRVLSAVLCVMQFPDHGLNRLNERLILFKHEYHSENMLLPINVASDVTEGALVEIVVSGIQIQTHKHT